MSVLQVSPCACHAFESLCSASDSAHGLADGCDRNYIVQQGCVMQRALFACMLLRLCICVDCRASGQSVHSKQDDAWLDMTKPSNIEFFVLGFHTCCCWCKWLQDRWRQFVTVFYPLALHRQTTQGTESRGGTVQ